MELPFEIFVMFLGIALTIGIIGIIMGIRKIDGAPFITIFAGILIFTMVVITVNIELDNNISNVNTQTQNITYNVSNPTNAWNCENNTADIIDNVFFIQQGAFSFAPSFAGSGMSCELLINSYALANNNSELDISTQDFAVSGIFFRAVDTGSSERILSKISGTNGYSIQISNTDKLEAQLRVASSTIILSTNNSINTLVWYAFAISFDRDGNMDLFLYNLDSNLLTEVKTVSISSLSGNASNTSIVHLGRNPLVSSEFWMGRLDNIQFNNGSLVSQAEFLTWIQQNFPTKDIVIEDTNTVNTYATRVYPFNQNEVWAYMIMLSALFIFIGVIIQLKRV